MRWLLSLSVLVACADDDAPLTASTRCEQGPALVETTWNAFVADSGSCTRDEDCVLTRLDLRCEGFEYANCGAVVAREIAAQWDAGAMCQEIEKLPAGDYSCSSSPSCLSPTPVCSEGHCSFER